MKQPISIRRTLAATAILTALLAAAGCAPGSNAPTATTSAAPVSTDIANAGQVTLKLSDFWGGSEGEWIKTMIKEFEAKYSNVTIKRTQEDWGQLTSTLNLQLADDDGPDMATANNGWQSLGTLAKGGLVLNLDNYSAAYGWDKLIPSTIARQNQFTTDFKTIGSGSLFSTPIARVSLIGVYYNVDELNKLGIAAPTTLAEFEAACAKIKAAGQIPINYGSQDSPTAVLLGLQALYASADTINNFTYGDTAVTASQAGLTEAATTVKKWNDNGWFTPHHEGINYQDAVANYLDGKGVFRFEYTGSLGLTDKQQGSFKYIQLPQANGTGTVGVGAAPAAMVIASKCKNPDVAAAFLDFLMSKEAAQAAADDGLIPLMHSDVTIASNMTTLQTEAAGADSIYKSNGFVPYFDWTSPTMLDTLNQQMQMLYAGKTDVAGLVAAVDKDRTTFLSQSK